MNEIKLRNYQLECLKKILVHFKAGQKRVLLQLPTGAGKTVTAIKLIEGVINKGQIVWWVTHRKELVLQAADVMRQYGHEPSFTASGLPWSNAALIQICSLQTLTRKVKNMSDAQRPALVILDEAHHCSSKSYQNVFDWLAQDPPYQLGLTATPRRLDRKPMSPFFDVLVLGPTIKELIDAGHLCQPALYVPPNSANYIEEIRDELHTKMGDYSVQDLDKKFLGNKVIYGDVIEHYEKLSGGQPTIVFCNSIRHSKEVAAEFSGAGYACEDIDGTMDMDSRKAALQRFSSGQTKVLTSVDLVGEGFDLPQLGCCILLRMTQSLTVFLQQVGRCMRPAPGKKEAVIIDHVNNSEAHGRPWINRYWSLDSYGAKEKKDELTGIRLKLCNKCGNYINQSARMCEECGNRTTTSVRQRKEGRVIQAELVKLTPSDILKRERHRMERKKLETFEDFLEFARDEKGWANPEVWAKKAHAQKLVDDGIYATGDKSALMAMHIRQKRQGDPGEFADKTIRNRGRNNGGNSEQHRIYTTGSLKEIEECVRKNPKLSHINNVEAYAMSIFKKQTGLQEVLNHGTPEEVAEAKKLLASSGSKGGPGQRTLESALKYARSVASKTDKETGHPLSEEEIEADILRHAQNIIKKDNQHIIDNGSAEEVLAVAQKMELRFPESFVTRVMEKRKPLVAAASGSSSSLEDDLFG